MKLLICVTRACVCMCVCMCVCVCKGVKGCVGVWMRQSVLIVHTCGFILYCAFIFVMNIVLVSSKCVVSVRRCVCATYNNNNPCFICLHDSSFCIAATSRSNT